MDFYEKWNGRWRTYVQKNRIKSLYGCDPEQIIFLNEATIDEVHDNIEEVVTIENGVSRPYCMTVQFLYNGETIVFKRVTMPLLYIHRWMPNTYMIKKSFFTSIFEKFPFDDMLVEWKELQKNR